MPAALKMPVHEAIKPEYPVSSIDENIESLLAQELNQMSFKEREVLYEEIHGVEATITETPELIQKSLFEMENEIQRISDKPAYDIAVQRFPEYVKGKKFRLMFLRADHFDVIRAARRVVRYMEEQRSLFGVETLGRPINYHDLDEDTKRTLQSGVFQWLPSRDRAGRAVFTNLHQILPDKCYKNAVDMVKMFAYFMMAHVEDDEETQKKGAICIFYFMGNKAMEFDMELHSRMPRTVDWCPLRITGLHFCSSSLYLTSFARMLVSTMTKNLRVRLRFHGGGSHTECQYSLLTFGLPTQSLPVNYEGEIKHAAHSKWIAKMKIRDEFRRQGKIFDGVVDLPATNDVLLGRGRTFQDHSGSIKLRALVDQHMDEYCDASKNGKTQVTWDVVKAIQSVGGRFLKRRDDGWWEIVSDEAARTKVGMSFRTALSTKTRSKMQEVGSTDAPRFVEFANGKRSRLMANTESNVCFGFCSS